ncbi:hypothetical protein OIU84_026764 [Salix udensis]|uniref:Uncharacterized protein n=1 Tax=Salix udensis TaxID=889485 RepID=A0AAD6KMV4_9ROSI|nr:hypothetical protein OIU84_026764 [Salix udensis]
MIYKMATFPFINKILLYPHHIYVSHSSLSCMQSLYIPQNNKK